nr:hypothetical protein Iba_scaffold30701CG0020 [Ipomoea batatas]
MWVQGDQSFLSSISSRRIPSEFSTTISNLSPLYISLSVADAKHVFTKSIASFSESGVTASWAGNNSGLGDFSWLSKKGMINVEPEP